MAEPYMKKWYIFFVNHKLIYIGMLINILFYISAYQTKWFDYFFPGTFLHLCCRGLDFYQIPNGAYAYLHGGSLSGVLAPGTKAYWTGSPLNNFNVYHPYFTLILGCFLILFEPRTSFYIWMFSKYFITLGLVILFYKNFKGHKYTDLAIFFMLTNSTQYAEIEISQFQFVLNCFILLMLINFVKNRDDSSNGMYYFLSLAIKPIGLLWLPILAFKKQFKTLSIGLILYIFTSAIFLVLGNGNYYTNYLTSHIFYPEKAGPNQIITLDAFLRYSMPLPEHILSTLKICCFATIIFLSSFNKVSLLKCIYLSIVFYLLFYDRVYEYQYTTLIPILAVCLVACTEFQKKLARILIIVIGLPNIFFVLHYFKIGFIQDPLLGPNPTAFGWQLIVLSRIVPLIQLTLFVLIPDIKLIYGMCQNLYSPIKIFLAKCRRLGSIRRFRSSN